MVFYGVGDHGGGPTRDNIDSIHRLDAAEKRDATCALEDGSDTWSHDVSGTLPDDRPAGWAVLNDGKYAYDVNGSEIGITAARSPVYAWHEPFELDPQSHYQYMDQGRQEFTYAVVPHGGELASAAVPRLADELNQPPLALPEHFHPGPLGQAQAFADDGGGAVVMTVLREAETGGRPYCARL